MHFKHKRLEDRISARLAPPFLKQIEKLPGNIHDLLQKAKLKKKRQIDQLSLTHLSPKRNKLKKKEAEEVI